MKLELTMSKVVVMKRKEDFMILTADVSNMNPLAKVAQDMFCVAILQELGLGQAPATATPMETGDDTHEDTNTHGQEGGQDDTHGQDGGHDDTQGQDGSHDDTYCDIDGEGL